VAGGAVAIALLLSGCGSSSKAASTTTSVSVATTVASTTTTSVTTTTVPSTTTASADGTEITRLPAVPQATSTTSPPNLKTSSGQRAFLTSVFADIQTTWKADFAAAGATYSPARLDLFTSRVSTACGQETAEVGPFYCSGDHTVYLDINFFAAMEAKFGVSGDFAEAYVVAHEVGHHIQNLLGITTRVAQLSEASPAQTNALSVRVELQADCFAGVWAHSTYERKLLEPGDIEEALHAAETVGDDYLAQAHGATVDPDSWTHGSSAQRQQWFTTGYEDGRPDACNTFSAG
jgi:predicted metalloprotease